MRRPRPHVTGHIGLLRVTEFAENLKYTFEKWHQK